MKAIFKKEFDNYFNSPIGYIFIGIFILMASIFFTQRVILVGKASMANVFSDINFIYLFLAALLTMRLLSEEKNKKTDQLLLSAPVSITEIVLGKYFAALAVFGLTMLLSAIYPIILFIYANPSAGEMLSSYLGFILLWSSFIAIGLFISSLTESQMIAGVLTFAVLISINYAQSIKLFTDNAIFVGIFNAISLFSHYDVFQTGVISIKEVVYYISVSAAFIFLTIRVMDRRRFS